MALVPVSITLSATAQSGIVATPSSIMFDRVIGAPLPPPKSITVTTSNGGRWSTTDNSLFYDASIACWGGAGNTCQSGAQTQLTPSDGMQSLPVGTHSSPLTISASGLNSRVVPVSVVVRNAGNSPPVWATSLPQFVEGIPAVINLQNFVSDADGDALSITLTSSSGDLPAMGLTWVDASDEIRYDGRLGVVGQFVDLIFSANDGVNVAAPANFRIMVKNAVGQMAGNLAIGLTPSATPTGSGGGGAEEITLTAASASLAHVQAKVDEAADGDVIGIPNGSATWSGGISTTKQIRIRAVNITPTPAGTTGAGTQTRNVTITNNSTTVPLFIFTSGNTAHCGVGGIRFNEGTGNQNAIRFLGSGSKVPLINDCMFQTKQRNGDEPDIAIIAFLGQGGVMWNCYFNGSSFPSSDGVGPDGGSAFILVGNDRAWTTASTMGTLDTDGAVNTYIEECTFENTGDVDIDDNGRLVIRHCLIDGSKMITHGFTSAFGGRFWEIYDSTFSVLSDERNHAGRYFWCRAGTGVFTDCLVNNASNPGAYGAPDLLMIGDNTTAGSYPMNRQPGGGHNGSAYVIDPIYIWSNTGTKAYTWGFNDDSSSVGWSSIVQLNRDIYVNSGAKSSYTKYTYPHPLRAAVEG